MSYETDNIETWVWGCTCGKGGLVQVAVPPGFSGSMYSEDAQKAVSEHLRHRTEDPGTHDARIGIAVMYARIAAPTVSWYSGNPTGVALDRDSR
jgi:hypothetical protein